MPRSATTGFSSPSRNAHKYIDGWYMGTFVYRAFKQLREEKATSAGAQVAETTEREEELLTR